SGLRRQLSMGVLEVPPDGMTPAEQLDAITLYLATLIPEHYACWQDHLLPALAAAGIVIGKYDALPEAAQASLRAYFSSEIFPSLTPLALDATHPFPFISNLAINLAVVLRNEKKGDLFARVKVPTGLFPRFIPVPEWAESDPDGRRRQVFVLLEDLISANLDLLFPGYQIGASAAFRITRDADIEIREDEASDLLTAIEESMEARRHGSPERLELDVNTPEFISSVLADKLGLPSYLVHRVPGLVGITDLMDLMKAPRPELKDPPFLPSVPRIFERNKDIFTAIRLRSILLYYPYESFLPFLQFLRTAATDPLVLAIKITLYRIDKGSPIIDTLIKARQNGKQVAAVVELKARFDEERNIEWARTLERVGVHVVYGMHNLKVHAKVCMVVRREGEKVVRYVHLGTGNFNAVTTRLYGDIGFFTTDQDFGADVTDLFNVLTGYALQPEYRQLLVAPVTLRREIVRKIEREIEHQTEHGTGLIEFKMNGLEDKGIIKALYRASRAGVPVRIEARGLCCLRPGIPGVSETITVTSVVDRFLEHARIYHFGNNGNDEVLLGSADMRPRNLNRRIEILFPLHDLRNRCAILDIILPLHLSDTVKARMLLPDGRYIRVQPKEGAPPVHAQQWLLEHRGTWQDK
ncbi:MAG: polyphosphate kinase 1, partial [Methanomicrobiales archaeon]|nr:polyphosphate kinase 1 [Methanomicrobiales archaeon]